MKETPALQLARRQYLRELKKVISKDKTGHPGRITKGTLVLSLDRALGEVDGVYALQAEAAEAVKGDFTSISHGIAKGDVRCGKLWMKASEEEAAMDMAGIKQRAALGTALNKVNLTQLPLSKLREIKTIIFL